MENAGMIIRNQKEFLDELINNASENLVSVSFNFKAQSTSFECWPAKGFVEAIDEVKQLRKENEELRKQNEWHDISTAPRDGTLIDVYVSKLEERYPDTYFDTNTGFFCHDVEGLNMRIVFDKTPPTHYRPLPKPPTTSEVK